VSAPCQQYGYDTESIISLLLMYQTTTVCTQSQWRYVIWYTLMDSYLTEHILFSMWTLFVSLPTSSLWSLLPPSLPLPLPPISYTITTPNTALDIADDLQLITWQQSCHSLSAHAPTDNESINFSGSTASTCASALLAFLVWFYTPDTENSPRPPRPWFSWNTYISKVDFCSEKFSLVFKNMHILCTLCILRCCGEKVKRSRIVYILYICWENYLFIFMFSGDSIFLIILVIQ
jgi:hypothetical protein